MKAEPGMVKIHAQTMFPATPQRTAESFCTEPTPMIDPVMVCVVDTGMPSAVARNRVIAPLPEAQKPPTGFNLVIRMPLALTIPQPPKHAPPPTPPPQPRPTPH